MTRIGRHPGRTGLLVDASTDGALVEFPGRLPVGTLLRLRVAGDAAEVLAAVVRTDFGADFARRYGVACVHGTLPSSVATSGVKSGEQFGEASLASPWPAARSEIRRRYRALALSAHPDVGGSAARFCAIHESYREALAGAPR